jgi:hypothetical protein
MGDFHAEMDVIQQAADKNLTQGQDMSLTVRGQSICDYCRSNLGDMADAAGLNSLTVYDTAKENVGTWVRNSDGRGGTWTDSPGTMHPPRRTGTICRKLLPIAAQCRNFRK